MEGWLLSSAVDGLLLEGLAMETQIQDSDVAVESWYFALEGQVQECVVGVEL
jgi:hypothetical protein